MLNTTATANMPHANVGSSDYYFDCLLTGPVLTIDILPMLYSPGTHEVAGTTPFTFIDGLDVTLLD